MAVDDFFDQYFIRPIFEATGYNIFNTLAYGGLLIAVTYVIFWLMERYKIGFDFDFVKTLTPFILFSAFVRVLTDAGFYPRSFFTVSPGIEIVIGLPPIFILLLLKHRYKQHIGKFAVVGVILCLTQLPFYRIVSWIALFQICAVFLVWLGLFYLLKNRVEFLKNPFLFWAFVVNMLDATATFVTIQFYSDLYFEQHLVANVFMNIFGAAGMFVMKLIALVPIFYLMERYGEDKKLNNLIYLIIFALGLAAGLRSAMRLVMMV
jgi:uncharacterized membrane protein